MSFDFPPYAVAFVLNAIIALTFGGITLNRRSTTGWKPFFWIMLAMADWSLARALEAGAIGIPAKVFWSKVEWIGILSFPPLWLSFALEYSQDKRWITRRRFFLGHGFTRYHRISSSPRTVAEKRGRISHLNSID